MSTNDFKDKIAAIAGESPSPIKHAPPLLVRKPTDRGYYPPAPCAWEDCLLKAAPGDIFCEGCRSAVARW